VQISSPRTRQNSSQNSLSITDDPAASPRDFCSGAYITALENGAQLEDVQKAAVHRDPGTTKLYDRRGYNPEKAASFFATY
jgi:hypothetical protein